MEVAVAVKRYHTVSGEIPPPGLMQRYSPPCTEAALVVPEMQVALTTSEVAEAQLSLLGASAWGVCRSDPSRVVLGTETASRVCANVHTDPKMKSSKSKYL